MLIPEKHLKLSDTLIGFGAFVLKNLKSPRDFDFLWKKYKEDSSNQKSFGTHSINNLILAIDFLYAVGLISLDEEGKIKSETSKIVSKPKKLQDSLF